MYPNLSRMDLSKTMCLESLLKFLPAGQDSREIIATMLQS